MHWQLRSIESTDARDFYDFHPADESSKDGTFQHRFDEANFLVFLHFEPSWVGRWVHLSDDSSLPLKQISMRVGWAHRKQVWFKSAGKSNLTDTDFVQQTVEDDGCPVCWMSNKIINAIFGSDVPDKVC